MFKEQIFKIIKNIKAVLFRKNSNSKIKMLEAAKEELNKVEELQESSNISKYPKEIQEKYFKIRKDEIKLEDLEYKELEKILEIMQKEIELQREKMEQAKAEKTELVTEINRMVKSTNKKST